MNNTTNNGNLQIIRVPQNRLLKKEMADYAEMTMGIVQKHDHQTSMFGTLYDKLVAKALHRNLALGLWNRLGKI